MSDEHEVETTCPKCGRTATHVSGVTTGDAPSDGDVSICWGCGELAVFVVSPLGVSVRLPTVDESDEIMRDPQLRRTLAAMRESYTPSQAIGLVRGSGS